eukprot:CAMPEP_0198242274 /NCGR_PEP_ID=MMETSP1446-20131203/14230_1 /TAXON_ID=1461542 ORGANISM="Unidentified sp, Strain CCMP2111" /NCGR_SAMPLE_ID=MMETSP1446 /ASSEMBLY_ACC=CAM_ASM_001112 /LENGTH=272 /DNA_ID=CAMNT_0043925643 /DNA_START=250 /DNA_END=1065 /DNA_ORIENTATION=-
MSDKKVGVALVSILAVFVLACAQGDTDVKTRIEYSEWQQAFLSAYGGDFTDLKQRLLSIVGDGQYRIYGVGAFPDELYTSLEFLLSFDSDGRKGDFEAREASRMKEALKNSDFGVLTDFSYTEGDAFVDAVIAINEYQGYYDNFVQLQQQVASVLGLPDPDQVMSAYVYLHPSFVVMKIQILPDFGTAFNEGEAKRISDVLDSLKSPPEGELGIVTNVEKTEKEGQTEAFSATLLFGNWDDEIDEENYEDYDFSGDGADSTLTFFGDFPENW